MKDVNLFIPVEFSINGVDCTFNEENLHEMKNEILIVTYTCTNRMVSINDRNT